MNALAVVIAVGVGADDTFIIVKERIDSALIAMIG